MKPLSQLVKSAASVYRDEQIGGVTRHILTDEPRRLLWKFRLK